MPFSFFFFLLKAKVNDLLSCCYFTPKRRLLLLLLFCSLVGSVGWSRVLQQLAAFFILFSLTLAHREVKPGHILVVCPCCGGEKKGSWEKGWTWTREEAHHDGTLWGIFSYLHSDILTQQHWQFQKSLSSYCDDVSTESCFVKIKLYFVFFGGMFFLLEGLWSCASFSLLSSASERPSPTESRKHERGKAAPSLPSLSEVKRLSVMKCDSWRISWFFSHCGKSLNITTSRVIKKNKTHVWHNRFSQ